MKVANEHAKKLNIINSLKKVIDPEIGMNIVDLGLIYGIEIVESSFVIIKMTLTTPGCPLADFFISEIETVLTDLEFVDDVRVEFVWAPAWDISMMDENAKQNMFKSMIS